MFKDRADYAAARAVSSSRQAAMKLCQLGFKECPKLWIVFSHCLANRYNDEEKGGVHLLDVSKRGGGLVGEPRIGHARDQGVNERGRQHAVAAALERARILERLVQRPSPQAGGVFRLGLWQ